MNRLLLTLAASVFTYSAMAQITITAPPRVIPNVLDSSTLPLSMGSLPSMGPSAGGSWDLDSISIQAAIHTSSYTPPTPSFSVANFAEPVRCTLFASSGIGYAASKNFRQTPTEIAVIGEEVLARQAFSLGSFTGNMPDSIAFLQQAIPYNNAEPVMRYPARLGSSWSGTTIRNLSFNLSLASARLLNAPAQHRQVRRYLDSVVGWGIMSVPKPGGGGSAWISVLQVQHTEIILDSLFFLTSAAAPVPIPSSVLAQIGLTQGQSTTRMHTYFYRAGTFRPLATAIHSAPSFSSAPSDFYMDARNLPSPLQVRSVAARAKVKAYPNPLRKGGNLYLDLAGQAKDGWNYVLMNMNGQVVAKDRVPVTDAPVAAITLPQGLNTGIYYLSLIGADRQVTVLPISVE